jgi:acyl carrier protein
MAAGSSHEVYLTRLWKVHLNRPSIDPDDNFFSSGGSSMQAIEMLMTVCDETGAEIDYSEFFREPCIRRLAQLLEG